MIRFAWLQSRSQTLVVLAGLAAVAVAAAVTGPHLTHVYATELRPCQGSCGPALDLFLRRQAFLQRAFDLLALLGPALLGMFCGAPLLAREFESGTYRLAWTQSVPRSRWLLSRLGVGLLTTLACAGILTTTITWWYRLFDRLGSNQYALFDRRDIVPVGYALFAFAAGALCGALFRRVLPAMATTLLAYAAARVAVVGLLRPNILPPLRKTMSLAGVDRFGFEAQNGGPLTLVADGSAGHNSWTLSSHLVSLTGQRQSTAQLSAFLARHCPALPQPGAAKPGLDPGNPAVFEACRQQAVQFLRVVVTYQPANRYWPLQWLELAVFTALTVVAAAGCYWWVRHRAA